MLDQDVAAAHGRRRSVDVGGLSHAMKNPGLGHGWGGWEEQEQGEIGYAELLSDMYNNTLMTVNEHHIQLPPFDLPNETRSRLIDSLDSWNFEPHKLPAEEVLSCTLILFETIYRIEGMEDHVGVSLSRISLFLRHLRRIYRKQNSYHNFEHALDVLQATHIFLSAAGVVPPVSILREGDDRMWRPDKVDGSSLASSLGVEDVFTLYIAAIGHDVGHPGFSNVFMKNAEAPLSAVFDGKSPLEQMHLALLLRVMRFHGLGHLLDPLDSGTSLRKLLWNTVLATDMSVHSAFMCRLKAFVDGEDISLDQRKVLICQAIIKCADISNPSRPYCVSQHWANALMREWTSQAELEKHFALPATVQPSEDPLSEAKSQVWFITNFAKPLMDLTAEAIPQMREYAHQCAANLKLWETRCRELGTTPEVRLSHPDGLTPPPPPPPPLPASASVPQHPDDFLNAFPLTLPPSLLTPQDDHHPSVVWCTLQRRSSSSSDSSSDSSRSYTTCPDFPISDVPFAANVQSPSPPLSPSGSLSPLLSPRSEFSVTMPATTKRPSSSGSIGSTTNDATAAIRAAYQASVRKKKSFHRNSWNARPSPSPSPASPPPPPPPLPLPSSKLAMSFQVGLVGPRPQQVTVVMADDGGGGIDVAGGEKEMLSARDDSVAAATTAAVLVGGRPELSLDVGGPPRTS